MLFAKTDGGTCIEQSTPVGKSFAHLCKHCMRQGKAEMMPLQGKSVQWEMHSTSLTAYISGSSKQLLSVTRQSDRSGAARQEMPCSAAVPGVRCEKAYLAYTSRRVFLIIGKAPIGSLWAPPKGSGMM